MDRKDLILDQHSDSETLYEHGPGCGHSCGRGQPTVDHELDHAIQAAAGVSRGFHRTVVNSVVPPHDLIDHQVSLCGGRQAQQRQNMSA